MTPLGERQIGPLYEMRLYTFPAEEIEPLLERWGNQIEEREKLSPLAGCWYSEHGGYDNFAHLWAYPSFEERTGAQAGARAGDMAAEESGQAGETGNKILYAAPFSPMQ